jgi:hypothetical protein
MSIFWGNDIHVLIQKEYIYEIIPINQMSYNEKLNALSRLIILLSCLGFICTFSFKYIIIGIISLSFVYLYHKFTKEGFKGNEKKSKVETESDFVNVEALNYYPTKVNNPLGNVLMTDYLDDPNRNPAYPSFNPEIVDNINNKSKEITKDLNKGLEIKGLYSGLGNNIEFDDLMHQFYSTAVTTIPNNQAAFGDYLYGNMPSCKDGDSMQCVKDNNRYILI